MGKTAPLGRLLALRWLGLMITPENKTGDWLRTGNAQQRRVWDSAEDAQEGQGVQVILLVQGSNSWRTFSSRSALHVFQLTTSLHDRHHISPSEKSLHRPCREHRVSGGKGGLWFCSINRPLSPPNTSASSNLDTSKGQA